MSRRMTNDEKQIGIFIKLNVKQERYRKRVCKEQILRQLWNKSKRFTGSARKGNRRMLHCTERSSVAETGLANQDTKSRVSGAARSKLVTAKNTY